ncbi:MAG: OmpA family protein [Desulfuromonadales bacterium]
MALKSSPIPASRPHRKPGETAGKGELCAQNEALTAMYEADRSRDRSARLSVSAAPSEGRGRYGKALLVFLSLAFYLLGALSAVAATPAGTTIENTAAASYGPGGGIIASSNRVEVITVARPRTPSGIDFLKYAPASAEVQPLDVSTTEYLTGESADSSFEPLAAPILMPSGDTLALGQDLPLTTTDIFHRGEPVFLRLSDPDQNINPTVQETVRVALETPGSSDTEILRLTETGPDTGIFTGYIQSSSQAGSPYDGRLEVQEAGTVEARYVDPEDGSDVSTSATLFDPFGIVFDSQTGLPVDGVEVTLVDAATGQPATVFGDDGVSAFPATITSGGTATDGNGDVYDFDSGAFRFPFVAPGDYRLLVTTPAGYAAPSSAGDADLQELPGAPFALAAGSRGEAFELNPGPALRIDIPVDPVSENGVWLRKRAGKDRAAIGDFVPYRVHIENPNEVPVMDAALTDRLPPGFRYQAGSARLDGEPTMDPVVAADGRTLTFPLGGLPPQSQREIRYVAEVTSGAEIGEAVNSAEVYSASGSVSNTAEAAVTVGHDFLHNSTFLMGRVVTGGCGELGPDEADGLADARIYLEDGTYVTTDENGMFHFEGVRPGAHVVQLDLDSVPEQYEVVACEENSRFAGRSYSQFVDLQGGSMWRTDFHVALKPRARGEVSIELSSDLNENTAAFRLPIRIGGVAVENPRLSLILPEGVRYLAGSSTLNGSSIDDPEAGFGGVLNYSLSGFSADQTLNMAFRCDTSKAPSGDSTARAVLTFDTPGHENQRTPVAENLLRASVRRDRTPLPDLVVRPHFPSLGTELSPEDKAELDDLVDKIEGLQVVGLSAIGHTDNVVIAPQDRHIFPDNTALSEARAKSVVRYLGDALELAPAQIHLGGEGSSQPMASNGTPEGRALNRRVEVRVQCEKVEETRLLELVKAQSGEQKVETTGLRPGEGTGSIPPQTRLPQSDKMPEIDKAWVEDASPGLEWIWPSETYGPPIPSIKAAVKHHPNEKVELLLDGEKVRPLTFEGTMANGAETAAVSLWRGIGIHDGDNAFEVIVRNKNGEETRRLKRIVHYADSPVKAELVPEHSNLVANGNRPAVIAVRFSDKDGYPAREGVVGDFSVDAPYAPWERKKSVDRSIEAQEQEFRPKFQVGPDGIALIPLEPTDRSGEVVLRFKLNDREQEIRAWLKPKLRDWVLVGLAEGTVGYNEVTGNMENLPPEADKDLYDDGRVAFFGKGRILGKWLLTMAYDSDKPDRKDKELFQIIDPDAYYTLYGDASQQEYEAASAEKLYVKMERDQFYALFGDYTTGLSKTELSRYSRSLTGLKSEFSGKYATFNLFASDTEQGFVKEEIRGDGTSGLYRLSREDIVLNSEKVTIEVRDRFRSEKIVSSRELSRHVDYNIDYEAGTLFFKEPIPSRDDNFNPVHIVVDYEVTGQGDASLNYGGRGAVRWPQKGVEIGATAVHEERNNAEGDLYGLDATWEITETTQLKGEVAKTDSKEPGVSRDGRAWLAELEHRSPELDGKIYVRELEDGFGLGQQSGSEEGTRKYGADGDYSLNPDLSLAGTVYRQENLETGAIRDVAQTDLTYDTDRYSLSTGLRLAEDAFENGEKERSTQALFGGTWQPFERLLLRAAHEQSIGGDDESSDFPTRTTLGADFKLTEATTLFAAQEFTDGDDTESQNTRVGFKTTPWTGGSLDSALERQTGENGPRMFALFGLNQSLQINERWSVDATLDRSQTMREPGAEDFDTDLPPASGDTEDFTAVSLGATYKLEDWSWANRLEYRDGDAEDKWGLFSAVVGEVRQGLGLSARAQVFTTESDAAKSTDGEIRLGLAYRPLDSRWIVLDRLDFRFEEESTDTFDYDNWRIINNLNANYKPNRRTQISLQYGLKYVRDQIDGASYDGFTDLTGVEARYDLTERWDIGLRGSLLHSWNGHQIDYGAGASLGYNVVKNAWVSLGYNLLGFRDEDFSRADFTAQGPFMNFRFKFDQNSVREAARWLGGNNSHR